MRFIDQTLRKREEERLYGTNRIVDGRISGGADLPEPDPLTNSLRTLTGLASSRMRATSQYVCTNDIRKDIEAINSMEKNLRLAETQKVPLGKFVQGRTISASRDTYEHDAA